MKIIMERAALLKGLAHVQSVVERRNTIPILSNVLIAATETGVQLIATDLDIEVQERLGGEVVTTGGVTTPVHLIYDIVRKLPDTAKITLTHDTEKDILHMEAGKARFALPCMPSGEFPIMAAVTLSHHFSLDVTELKNLLDKTRFAISMEETRYYLNGIYLHTVQTDNGTDLLCSVATDGHRLARYHLPMPAGAGGMTGIIIPRKTVLEVRKLLDDNANHAEISVSDTKIRFKLGDLVLTSKLIDGTFPDYKRVIPAHNNRILTVDAKPFLQSVDRVATVSTEKVPMVKISFSEQHVEISTSGQAIGTAQEELDCVYQGEEAEVGFNARYLQEVVGHIDDEKAVFRMGEGTSPIIVQDETERGSLFILMPIRL